jgi:hypothetical protein
VRLDISAGIQQIDLMLPSPPVRLAGRLVYALPGGGSIVV